jgi:hypothetical protein
MYCTSTELYFIVHTKFTISAPCPQTTPNHKQSLHWSCRYWHLLHAITFLIALPTASQTVPSIEATSASSFLDSSEINPDLSAAQRIASAAHKKTLLDRWNQPPKPLSLLDALSSVGISVPCGRPRFGTMGSLECTLAPNTLIVSLVRAYPCQQHKQWKSFLWNELLDESNLFQMFTRWWNTYCGFRIHERWQK